MQKRLTSEKADVANIALVQNVESSTELVCVDPAQGVVRNFSIREVAEIAGSIAGVGDGHIAERRPAPAQQPHHVPRLRRHSCHSVFPGGARMLSYGSIVVGQNTDSGLLDPRL